MASSEITWERDYQLNVPLGSRVKVFWTGERRWFFGVIDDTRLDADKTRRIHHVTYNDGDRKWHHLPSELWLHVKDAAKEKAEKQAEEAAAMAAVSAAAAFAAVAEKKGALAKKATATAPAPAARKRNATEAAPAATTTSAKAPPSRRPKASKKRPRGALQSPFVDTPFPSHWVERDVVPVVESIPALPPLSARSIEHFPCGVVKLAGFLSDETLQRLYDTVMIAGWDHRVSGSYADSVYTNAKGAPNILLHWNYYSAPKAAQPPPMAVLQIADAVYRGYREMEGAHEVASSDDDDQASEQGDAGAGVGVSWPARHRLPRVQAHVSPGAEAEVEASCSTAGSARRGKAAAGGDTSGDAASRAAERAALRRPASPTQAEKEQELEEERLSRCAFPAHPDFQSVLALGYRTSDTFRWHTDMAGDDGWVCSFSMGSTATFEYLPKIAPSAKKRIEALSKVEPISVPIGCGDCVLFHGGYLPHRITHCGNKPSAAFARMNADPSVVRLNLQVRVYGASASHGLAHLTKVASGTAEPGSTSRDDAESASESAAGSSAAGSAVVE